MHVNFAKNGSQGVKIAKSINEYILMNGHIHVKYVELHSVIQVIFVTTRKSMWKKQPRKRDAKKETAKTSNLITGPLESAMKPLSLNNVHPTFQHLLEKFKISQCKESLLPPAYFSTNSNHMEKLGENKSEGSDLLTISHDLLVSQLGRTVDVQSGIAINEKNAIFLQNPSLLPYCSVTLVSEGTYDSTIDGFSLNESQLNHYIESSSQNSTSIIFAETNDDMNNHNAVGDKFSLDTNNYFNNDYLVNIDDQEENAK